MNEQYGFETITPTEPKRTSVIAVFSMIFGLAGFFTSWMLLGMIPGVAAIILALFDLAVRKIKTPFSVIGMITGAVAILTGCTILALAVTFKDLIGDVMLIQ